MKKYILACSAVIFMCAGCGRESSDTDSTIQESKKWEDVENIGVDPLNEDASGDAQSATSKEEETSVNSKEGEQQDHWHDGTWTDDENNESLSAQEKITKDSIEKIKTSDEKSADSSEEETSVNSKEGEQQDHWHDGTWTDDENNESLSAQEKITKDSIEKIKSGEKTSVSSSEKESSADSKEVEAAMQPEKDWKAVEDLGVDPLNEDALDDAQAGTTKEKAPDHWHDGTWTDDENNESLDAQEKITKDSVEKIKSETEATEKSQKSAN